jgi:hypothetical protein
VTAWLESVSSEITRVATSPVVVVLDPEALLPEEYLSAMAETVGATDWWSLRQCWELRGRLRTWSEGRLVVHATGPAGARDQLPYDISRAAMPFPVAWPVPRQWRELLRSFLTEPEADIIVNAARHNVSTRDMLQELLGISLAVGVESGELLAVSILRSRPSLPDSVWDLVGQTLQTPIARSLATQPPEACALTERWESWLHGERDDTVLRGAGSGLLGLVTAGLLPRVADISASAPSWAHLAATDTDVVSRATALLAEPPLSELPNSFSEWSAVAGWMGAIRGLLSLDSNAPDSLLDVVTRRALEFDDAFGPWLQGHFGQLLQSAAIPPVTLNKVAPFLARRVEAGERVLLIILDGLGFAQWEVLLEKTALQPLQRQACLSMLPSETSFSRQALLSGTTPDGFASSWNSTAKEEARWQEFWAERSVPSAEVRYHRVDGLRTDFVPLSSTHRAVAVVISAVDKLMHDSGLLGDVQLAAGLASWCHQGYLVDVVQRAADAGFETWLTADHGNVVADAGGRPPEGLRVERPGTRARLYRTAAMRDASARFGVPWTPPRLPPDIHVLFAPNRKGFHAHGTRVTHGGLSFEEVFVPLARLT